MEEEKKTNRRKIENIKRLILVVFLLACALPMMFCLYLLFRMSSMERKIDELSDKLDQTSVVVSMEETDNEDLLLLDQQAIDDLEKSTVSQNPSLAQGDSYWSEPEATEEEEATSEEGVSVSKNYNGKKVYLTFDDGPSPYTDELLDILKQYNVKATFFVVYNEKEETWPAYKRIVEDGHVLAMHSYSHVYSEVYASKEAFIADVTAIHDFLYEQTGYDCNLYRFPGGSSNTVSNVDIYTLIDYLTEQGITYYDWNALSEDAVDASLTPDQMNEITMGYVRNNPGDSVILLHDLEDVHATMEALSSLIETLLAEGYTICPIDENTIPVQHVEAPQN